MWSEKVPPSEHLAPPASPRTKQEPDISFQVKITKEKNKKNTIDNNIWQKKANANRNCNITVHFQYNF